MDQWNSSPIIGGREWHNKHLRAMIVGKLSTNGHMVFIGRIDVVTRKRTYVLPNNFEESRLVIESEARRLGLK